MKKRPALPARIQGIRSPEGLKPQGNASGAEVLEKARAIFLAGTAPNTRKAYERDMGYWNHWCTERFGCDLPIPTPVEIVICFITDHREAMPDDVDRRLVELGVKRTLGRHAVETVTRRISALSVYHRERGFEDNPCELPQVRALLSKARRAAAREGETPRKMAAATGTVLEAMLATCGEEDMAGIRDRALLLFAFSTGGRRRSEVEAARVEDLSTVENGYLFRLSLSKTDQEGKGRDLPVFGRAAVALRAWLTASGVTEGPLFRRVSKGGKVLGPLSGQGVRLIVKKRARLAGLDARRFAAHSLRSGFITEGGRRGITLGDIMALSGHTSLSTALGYYQAGSVSRNPAAWLAEESS